MWKRAERLAATARNVGALRAIAIAPIWLIHRRFVVATRVLNGLPAASIPVAHWEPLAGREVDQLLGVNPLLEADDLHRRIESGMRCFACRAKGEIVHYRWYATGPVWLPFLSVRWMPEAGDYTTLDVFTIERMRGRGIHKQLSIEGLARAREEGLQRSVSFVAWWNEPSLGALRGVGFTGVGTASLWCGPVRHHTASGAVSVRDCELRVRVS